MYFIARRIFVALIVALFVSLFIFLIVRIAPGDPAVIIAGDAATSEQIEGIRETLGLSRPVLIQFSLWLSNVIKADFGYSYYYYKNVTEIIGQRVGPTVSLAVLTILFAIIISIPAAIV